MGRGNFNCRIPRKARFGQSSTDDEEGIEGIGKTGAGGEKKYPDGGVTTTIYGRPKASISWP